MSKKLIKTVNAILVLSTLVSAAEKKVLLEYLGQASCPPCPGGHVLMERALHEYGDDKVILLSHEAEAMHNNWQDQWTSFFVAGSARPVMTVDRNQPEYRGYMISDSSTYRQEVSSRVSSNAFVDIQISHSFDSKSNQIEGFLEITFEKDTILTNPRVSLIVAEDSVHSSSPAYTQINSWSSVPGFPELLGKGSQIKNYMFPMVERDHILGVEKQSYINEYIEGNHSFNDSISGLNNLVTINNSMHGWGIKTSIQDTIQAGETYKVPFRYTIPQKYGNSAYEPLSPEINQLHLIAAISNEHPTTYIENGVTRNSDLKEVLNANSIKVKDFDSTFVMPDDTISAILNQNVNTVFTHHNQAFNTSINTEEVSNISIQSSRKKDFEVLLLDLQGTIIGQKSFTGGHFQYDFAIQASKSSKVMIFVLKSSEGYEKFKLIK
ncbi:hypothetical protein OAU52_00085 [bacterium]|nr:hypothetical protein [bacterium]